MTILFNDFINEPEELKTQELAAIQRCLNSGHYILGKEIANFESAWASSCGTNHAIGVANGMDAIEIILRALNIGTGDEVIVPAMTAFASVLAIIRAGATPVLADIDLDTALLSLASAESLISTKTKAVVLVHLYGRLAPMDAWLDFCKAKNILLIEDCAQAHLASASGKRAGSFGVAGAYSFYPTKNLGCKGDGGSIVTNDPVIAEKARALRHYGQTKTYQHDYCGLNSRLDEIQAAILSVRLAWLEDFTKQRQKIAGRYRKEINNPKLSLLKIETSPEEHVQHLFVIKCQQRDELKEHLADKNIQTLIHYPRSLDEQHALVGLLPRVSSLKNSQEFSRICLSIPCRPGLKEEEASQIIESINEF